MRSISWQLILKQAPDLIDAAGNLLTAARRRSAEVATAEDLVALRDRVAELARDHQANADLLKQLTDHLNAIAEGAHATAKRARAAVVVGTIGAALGLLASLLALLR